MASSGRTVVVLPTLTAVGLHTKSTNRLTCVDAYQTLPDPVLTVRTPLVILVWSTRAYHVRDLGLGLPAGSFTNHYHRGEGITHSGLDYVLCGVITIVLMWR